MKWWMSIEMMLTRGTWCFKHRQTYELLLRGAQWGWFGNYLSHLNFACPPNFFVHSGSFVFVFRLNELEKKSHQLLEDPVWVFFPFPLWNVRRRRIRKRRRRRRRRTLKFRSEERYVLKIKRIEVEIQWIQKTGVILSRSKARKRFNKVQEEPYGKL